jgi:hypothetical protein
VIKYGIDPATLKAEWKGQAYNRFPYIQTYISNAKAQQWTTFEAGTLTEWDFQASFFTSPEGQEFANDAVFFRPFEAIKNGLSNRRLNLLQTISNDGKITTIADIYEPIQFHYDFQMKSGSPTPNAFMICKMRAVCGYGESLAEPDPTLSTNLDEAITITEV